MNEKFDPATPVGLPLKYHVGWPLVVRQTKVTAAPLETTVCRAGLKDPVRLAARQWTNSRRRFPSAPVTIDDNFVLRAPGN